VPVNGSLSLVTAPMDVHPRVPLSIDFFKAGRNDKRLEPAFAWPFRLRGVFDDIGLYRVILEVIGDGIGQSICVEINWTGQWDQITGRQV
jgi:hypothetical protein